MKRNMPWLSTTLICISVLTVLFLSGCRSQASRQSEQKTSAKTANQTAEKSSPNTTVKVVDANPYYVETLGRLMIPFVVENQGKSDVYDVSVVAAAYDRKGEFLAKTSSDERYGQDPPEKVNPSRIEPGGKGYGILCLGNLRDYQGIKFQVRTSGKPGSPKRRELRAVQNDIHDRYQNPAGNAGTKTVLGTVSNDGIEEVHDVFVSVAVFDKDGKIVDFVKAPSKPDRIAPSLTASFTIDIAYNRPLQGDPIIMAEGTSGEQ
jgi:hypothetical protein